MQGEAIEPAGAAAEPVSFVVTCRTSKGARGRRHPVTLRPDWSLDTPHDLQAEAVGVALGGYHSCVELAHRVLPAVRDLVLHRRRAVAPHLALDSDLLALERLRWVPAEAPAPCRCPSGFPTSVEVAEHLRLPQHWAAAHGCTPGAVDRLLQILADAGADIDEPALPTPAVDVAALVVEPSGIAQLWRGGVHPERVGRIHRGLGLGEEPMPAAFYLAVSYRDVDLPWLSQFIPYGPHILTWAAATRGAADTARPTGRLPWVDGDVRLKDILVLMAVDADPQWALDLAADLHTSMPVAARILAGWYAADADPDRHTLVTAYRAGGNLGFVPTVALLDAVGLTLARTAAHSPPPSPKPVPATGMPWSRRQLAAALTIAGTVPAAAALLIRGGLPPSLLDTASDSHTETDSAGETP